MGQMRGDGQHPVMMARLHDLDLAAGAPPQLGQLRHRRLVAARRRGQDAPASLEEFGESGFRPGMLRAGHGMAGNQMHAIGKDRPQIADDRLLGRSHIADDCTMRQMIAHGGPDLGIGPQRRANHHQIGAGHASSRIGVDAVEKPQLPGLIARLLAARRAGDMAGQALALDDPGKRGADQPQADQCHPLEQRLAHRRSAASARAPAKSANAAATARVSASVPMVMRRQLLSP